MFCILSCSDTTFAYNIISSHIHFSHFDLTSASRFVIDYATSPDVRLLVDIQAAFAIPILRSYGEVIIQVNDDGALLKGKIKFLEVLNPTVEIKWDVSPCLYCSMNYLVIWLHHLINISHYVTAFEPHVLTKVMITSLSS